MHHESLSAPSELQHESPPSNVKILSSITSELNELVGDKNVYLYVGELDKEGKVREREEGEGGH